jgi:hypothetical protein
MFRGRFNIFKSTLLIKKGEISQMMLVVNVFFFIFIQTIILNIYLTSLDVGSDYTF